MTDEAGWCGFKVVGDNIDKNVRPRHMRLDKGTQSLHYFNAYAIMDRVDCSSKEIPHHQPPATCDPLAILPTEDDYLELFSNFVTMLQRILVTHIPAFGSLRDTVTWHVEHEYSNEMKRKSFVVSLDLQTRLVHAVME